jgi:hypothetical protein
MGISLTPSPTALQAVGGWVGRDEQQFVVYNLDGDLSATHFGFNSLKGSEA